MQTVILPGEEQGAPIQILNLHGNKLLQTKGNLKYLQYFNVNAPAPLVIAESEAGSAGQSYHAFMYDNSSNTFKTVYWGDRPMEFGHLGFEAKTKTFSLTQRLYGYMNNTETTHYEWKKSGNESIGKLTLISRNYHSGVTLIKGLPNNTEQMLIAALSSISYHLATNTDLLFENGIQAKAFYKKWVKVIPFGSTFSVNFKNWSNADAGAGKAQTVNVEVDPPTGSGFKMTCVVSFKDLNHHDVIQSISLHK